MAFKGTDFVPTVDTVGAEEDFWGLGSIAQTPLAEPEIAAQPTEINTEINTETTQQPAVAASPEATMPTAEEIDSSDIAKEIAQQEARLASLKQQQSALSATAMSVDGIQADAAKMGVNGGAGDKIKAAAALSTNDPDALERAIGEAELDAGSLSQVEGDIEHKKKGEAVGGALRTVAAVGLTAGAALETLGATLVGAGKDGTEKQADSNTLSDENAQQEPDAGLAQRIAEVRAGASEAKQHLEDAATLNLLDRGATESHLALSGNPTEQEVKQAEQAINTANLVGRDVGEKVLTDGTNVNMVAGAGKNTLNVNQHAGEAPQDEQLQAQASVEKTNELKQQLGKALFGATVAASFLPGGAAAASLEAAMPGMRAAYASNFIERDATGGTTNNYAGLENKPAAGAEAMPGANNRYVVMNNPNNNMLGGLAPTSIGIGQEGQGIGKV